MSSQQNHTIQHTGIISSNNLPSDEIATDPIDEARQTSLKANLFVQPTVSTLKTAPLLTNVIGQQETRMTLRRYISLPASSSLSLFDVPFSGLNSNLLFLLSFFQPNSRRTVCHHTVRRNLCIGFPRPRWISAMESRRRYWTGRYHESQHAILHCGFKCIVRAMFFIGITLDFDFIPHNSAFAVKLLYALHWNTEKEDAENYHTVRRLHQLTTKHNSGNAHTRTSWSLSDASDDPLRQYSTYSIHPNPAGLAHLHPSHHGHLHIRHLPCTSSTPQRPDPWPWRGSNARLYQTPS